MSGKGVGDHFPLPKSCGGVATVDCCESCHDMKDRFNFESWPVEWMAKIVEDFPKMSRETRIFLAKAGAMLAQAQKMTQKSEPDNQSKACESVPKT